MSANDDSGSSGLCQAMELRQVVPFIMQGLERYVTTKLQEYCCRNVVSVFLVMKDGARPTERRQPHPAGRLVPITVVLRPGPAVPA
jgi:hypothetical protein